MTRMLNISLSLNMAILAPLCFNLFVRESKGVEKVIGPDTQARRILSSMYFTILTLSAKAITMEQEDAVALAVPLFWTQIIYKTTTLFHNIKWNQVIWANLGVTVVHLCTLYALHKEGVKVLF